ncbi:Ribonuclease P protein subunit p29 [Durusdinium trenchii]|uniref:Ribonuclease P protein subunit p29 n=1 Tax=Durusdinium trenchii TaxID=1381693 RepID=A0ABP0ICA2_9DINO
MDVGVKRPVADPEGPVLELLRVFKIENAPGYYEGGLDQVGFMDCSLFRVTCACSCNPRVPSTCSQARKGKELWRFKYEDFEALRQLWKEYIEDLQLDFSEVLESDLSILSSLDLHGSHLEVVASKTPNLLRLSGTVIEETQRTFRIITLKSEVKMIPKDNCVFEVELPGSAGARGASRRLRLFGPSTCSRFGAATASRAPGGTRNAWRL